MKCTNARSHQCDKHLSRRVIECFECTPGLQGPKRACVRARRIPDITLSGLKTRLERLLSLITLAPRHAYSAGGAFRPLSLPVTRFFLSADTDFFSADPLGSFAHFFFFFFEFAAKVAALSSWYAMAFSLAIRSCVFRPTRRRHMLHDKSEYHAVLLEPSSTAFDSFMISLNLSMGFSPSAHDQMTSWLARSTSLSGGASSGTWAVSERSPRR